ncbi:MAG TPA: XRE family transcriptional regulator [Nitrospinaceae bacterium]|jgi:transcriptional regulator with XRE-family HTH domain|nr:XRE family transcriptional regulator [Nitrospinaceae bacterium]
MLDIIGAGTRIRKWRKSVPMKSFELARLIKISQGSLSDIENNKSNPSASTIVKFMKYTNLNVHWMLTGQKGDMKTGKITEEDPPFVITMNPRVKKVLIQYED